MFGYSAGPYNLVLSAADWQLATREVARVGEEDSNGQRWPGVDVSPACLQQIKFRAECLDLYKNQFFQQKTKTWI